MPAARRSLAICIAGLAVLMLPIGAARAQGCVDIPPAQRHAAPNDYVGNVGRKLLFGIEPPAPITTKARFDRAYATNLHAGRTACGFPSPPPVQISHK